MTVSYVLLPQMSGNGYYSYSPTVRQYGTPEAVKTIVTICQDWFRNQKYIVGIGDMSFVDGHHMAPHHSHKNGKCVDVRPLRTDHLDSPVTIQDQAYDRDATTLLVRALLAYKNVEKILFNDAKVPGVTNWIGHDNHLHIAMKS